LKIVGHGVMDKKIKVKFGTTAYLSKGLLDCVHIDIWGLTKTVTLGDHRCFVSFIDDVSKRYWVYLMR